MKRLSLHRRMTLTVMFAVLLLVSVCMVAFLAFLGPYRDYATKAMPRTLWEKPVWANRLVDTAFPDSPAKLFTPLKPRSGPPQLLQEYYDRARRVDTLCRLPRHRHRNSWSTGWVRGVLRDAATRVAYCYLPKTGCTFWVRVFSYLHNFTGEAVTLPWHISRLKMHNTSRARGLPWTPSVKAEVEGHLRFMFVRHPYGRLWSAYLDKLFLPDFWAYEGVRIVRKVRGENATAHALRCGSDVSFREFVEYAVSKYEPHWSPVSMKCDPCLFKPHVIGKMDTFDRDSRFVLKHMGIGWVMEGVDQVSQKEQELSTLVDYNFQIIRFKHFYKDCINATILAPLLWRTFQMNGYIPSSIPYQPPPHGKDVSKEEFKSRLLQTFRVASKSMMDKLLHQKKAFLHEAFESLPPILMQKVTDLYAEDMQFFDFSAKDF